MTPTSAPLELAQVVGIVAWLVLSGALLAACAALRFFDAEALDRDDVVLTSVVLALPVIGTVGQFLGLVGLFRWPVIVLLPVVTVAVFRSQARELALYATALPSRAAASVRRDPPSLLAWLLLAAIIGLYSLQGLFPSANIDVWTYHVPIAESLAQRHHFVFPTIGDIYYGSMPSFTETLFALGLLFTRQYIVANFIEYAVLATFVIWLAASSMRRLPVMIVAALFVLADPVIYWLSIEPMVDAGRACFAAAGIILLLRFLARPSRYYLVASGLLVGADLATKYLGLLTVFVAGLLLLFRIRAAGRSAVKEIGWFALGVALPAALWYVKNAVLYANPVYPYFLGHPGISDQSLAEMVADQNRAFDPAFRGFTRHLASLSSWLDYFRAASAMFFGSRMPVLYGALVIIVGAALVRPKRWENLLLPLAVVGGAIWYFFVFNSTRFGTAQYALLLAAFWFAAETLLDAARTRFRTPPWILTSAGVVAVLALILIPLVRSSGYLAQPFGRSLVGAALGRVPLEPMLAERNPGYAAYGFIARNRMTRVFNPLDNGAQRYIKYWFGANPDSVFPKVGLAANADDVPAFVKRAGIRYYVVPPPLSAIATERLGDDLVQRTSQVFRYLAGQSDRVYLDSTGWQVWRVRSGGP